MQTAERNPDDRPDDEPESTNGEEPSPQTQEADETSQAEG